MANHEYYEELCAGASAAVANSGQLSEDEWRELISHLTGCVQCRALTADFAEVSFQLVKTPRAAGGPVQTPLRLRLLPVTKSSETAALGPSDVSTKPQLVYSRRSTSRTLRIGIAFAAAMVICFAAGITIANSRNRPVPTQIVHIDPSAGIDPNAALVEEKKRLEAQLNSAEQRATSALTTSRATEAELRSKIAQLDQANAELTRHETEDISRIALLQGDLKSIRSENEANRNSAFLAHAELADRGTELKRINTQLEVERRKNAALTEAQDLITSPDAHVWEFHDNDENGKRVPFGKILYRQGRKLVLYAYNLPENSIKDTTISFYVWGEKPGTHQPIRSLGILRADDDEAHRWTLSFDNAAVLTTIDALFVTAESGHADKPKGPRLLNARLDPKADLP